MSGLEVANSARRDTVLFDHAPIGIFRTSLDGTFLEVNAAGRSLLNISPDEQLESITLEQLYESPSQFQNHMELLQNREALPGGEFFCRRSQSWVCAHLGIDYDHQQIAGFIADITDRKNREIRALWERERLVQSKSAQLVAERETFRKSELRYRALIDNTTDAVWSVNTEFCYETANTTIRRNVKKAYGVEVELGKSALEGLPHDVKEMWRNRLSRVLAGEDMVVEERFELEGIPEWFEVSINPIRDEGKIIGVSCIARDISSRKEYERTLKRARERLEVAGTAGHIGFWEVDRHKRVTLATDKFRELVGYESAETGELYDFIVEHIHNTDIDKVARFHRDLFSGHVPWGELEIRYEHPQKGRIWLYTAMRSLGERDPAVITGFLQDVTDRKIHEEQISIFKTLVESSGQGVAMVDMDGVVYYVNPTLSHLLGVYDPDEIIGKNALEFYTPEMARKLEHDILPFVLAGNAWSGELSLKASDGQIIPTLDSIFLIRDAGGQPIYYADMVTDMSQRKAILTALRERESLFRKIFENSAAGIATTDLAGNILEVNEQFCAMVGYSRNELRGRNAKQLTHTRDWEQEVQLMRELIEHSRDHVSREKRFIHRSGKIVYARLSVSLIYDQSGSPMYTIGVVQNITEQHKAELRLKTYQLQLEQLIRDRTMSLEREISERKTTEEHLRQSRTQLRMFLDFAPFGAHLYSYSQDCDDLVFSGYSLSANRILGIDHSSLIGKHASKSAPPLCNDKLQGIYRNTALSGTPFYAGEIEHIDRERKGFFEVQVFQAAPAQAVVFFSDITQRKLAQEALEQSLREKEVLLRELYHRTKNNMQVIASMLDLQAAYEDRMDLFPVFQEIESRIVAMALVHQKLYQSQDLSRIDLGEYMTDLSRNLQKSYASVNRTIEMQFHLARVFVLIDIAIPVGLVLNEIITNALKHAFPEGKSGAIHLGMRRRGSCVVIRVEDNGIGIGDSVNAESGGGLGMQLIRTIAQNQLKGRIRIGSANPGTRVTLLFQSTLYKERI